MNKSPNDMVLSRIFAQHAARRNWLARHRLVFSLCLGGLGAVLGVAALLWTWPKPNGNSLKATSSNQKAISSSDRETAKLAVDTETVRGKRLSDANPAMTSQGAAVATADKTEPKNKETPPTARSSADESRRVTAGPISFVPPENWEKSNVDPNIDPSALLVFLAPSESRWKQLGFGPILSASRGPHPRMSLESLKAGRERILQGSVEKVNEYLRRVAAREPLLSGNDVALAKKPEFSQVIRNIDGSPVLVSTCYSLIVDRSRALAIKSRTYTIIRPEGLYIVGMTYPVEAEEEMDRVWQAIEGTVRISR